MHHFTACDGIEIAYHTWGDRSEQLPVLLHHGFAFASSIQWRRSGLADALTRAGRFVIAIDARGHGQSGKPHDPSAYGESKMASDLIALADHCAIERYDLVGYSMGAVVCAIAATRDPRIRRLGLGGIGASLVESGGVDTHVLPSTMLIEALEREGSLEHLDPRGRGIRALVDATGGDRFALAAHLRVLNSDRIPLESIAARTMILAGNEDPLAQRPEVLQAALRGAELVRVPGDHMSAGSSAELHTALIAFLSAAED